MSGIFHEGRWYENTDMICRRCGRPVYDSDNPEYRYQCFHCDEDFYSFEVEEQDALYLPPVMVARPVDGITLNEALEYLLDDNPTSERTYLHVVNNGSIFSELGQRIVVGGWMNPTIYSVGNTFCPIFNTRQGPGQPILYLSLYSGRPRLMLYNSSGSLILDESVTPPFSLVNNGWYFLAAVIEPEEYKACYVVGDRSTGTVWISNELTIEGELNRSCTADLIMGMHADTYTSEVRISTLDCSNFTNPYQMLEYTQMRLAQYAQPRVSYVLSAMDLSALTGYEHEAWALGDIVTVDDKDLNLSVKTRVVRRQYNLQEPWKTVLELSTTLRELGDSSAQWDKAADVLASTDVIDRQEVKDLVPFNHLRNSRADSGMNYWTNSGFEVDAENGVSGTASFKAEGVLGMTKSLTQTVYPASRRSYTFSAQIASEDLQKGPSGQVGIEVTFEYEDGSTETRFIDLF